MESTALLPLYGLARDEVSHVNHVSELTDVAGGLHTFEEGLGLLVEQVETVPGALQAEVAAHYSDVVRHYLAHLLDALGDEHFLLVGHSSLVVPFRHIGVERVRVDSLERMALQRRHRRQPR